MSGEKVSGFSAAPKTQRVCEYEKKLTSTCRKQPSVIKCTRWKNNTFYIVLRIY